MWRCVNDLFSYCVADPNGPDDKTHYRYQGVEGHDVEGFIERRTCQNDPKSCPYHRTLNETLPAELIFNPNLD